MRRFSFPTTAWPERGVLDLDALLLYRAEKRPSSIAGKISSAKIFAQVFSRAFSHAQLVICGLSVFTVKY